MIEKLQKLTPDQMRKIMRYEVAFTDVISLPETYDDIYDFVSVPERYACTLEDLEAALGNLIQKDPTVEEFGNNWYYPLTLLEADFGIDAAYGFYAVFGMDPEAVHDLPTTREQLFLKVWDGLNDLWIDSEDDARISSVPGFSEYLEEIRCFLKEEKKPVTERAYPKKRMLAFIGPFGDDDRVAAANNTELALCRRFTEELISEDSIPALRLKGYACYGGNALYACDWPASRDCMLRLYELTDDHTYANTLGYIYYYGRCTGGKPEYEKAFQMFAIAAANGQYEGIYKLADMFRHGYAVKKSEKTARALYGMCYEDCRKKFIDGYDGSFADAAIRMGSVHLKGIAGKQNPETAYARFLEADYAHRLRSENSDFFGDATVAINIKKSLDEVKALLGEDYFQEYFETDTPVLLPEILKGNYRCDVHAVPGEDGEPEITLKRMPVHKGLEVEPVLLTFPQLSYCTLADEVTLKAPGTKIDPVFLEEGPHIIDYAEWNHAEQCLDCYFADAPVGRFFPGSYRFYAPEKEAPSGRKLRFVSIRFNPCGRLYDYLVEDDSVAPGDTVTVPGYNGDTDVAVVKVFTAYESELAIPVSKYKKAVKAAPHK